MHNPLALLQSGFGETCDRDRENFLGSMMRNFLVLRPWIMAASVSLPGALHRIRRGNGLSLADASKGPVQLPPPALRRLFRGI
jgi:hypothetical protein